MFDQLRCPVVLGSSAEKDDARHTKECDNTRRKVTVKLFTRVCDPRLPDNIHYHHWALVFEFLYDDVRTVEGFGNKNKKLYPKYTKTHPKETGNFFFLCDMECSPLDVLEAAQSNPENGKEYIASWDNCQTWAKGLAHKMGGEIAENIDNYETLRQANPLVAVAGVKKDRVGSFSC